MVKQTPCDGGWDRKALAFRLIVQVKASKTSNSKTGPATIKMALFNAQLPF